MAKSRRKAMKTLTQSKIVDIADYRDLKQGKELLRIAVVSPNKEMLEGLKTEFQDAINLESFDSRFAFEQALKAKDFDAAILDETSLGDDALQLCERVKRQQKMEDLVIFILSNSNAKDKVRSGLEKGCDEWLSTPDDFSGVHRLLKHHLSFR